MNYSNKATDCRIDTFKPSGKWYDTLVLDMSLVDWTGPLPDQFRRVIEIQYPHILKESGWLIVCLNPCHKDSHPLCIIT